MTFDHLQVYHSEGKVTPSSLQVVIGSWVTAGCESGSRDNPETDFLKNFMCNISDEVCSQLHNGIMRATRKVVLDEIIGHVITEHVTAKKAEKHLKLEESKKMGKTCSLDCVMVINFVLAFIVT